MTRGATALAAVIPDVALDVVDGATLCIGAGCCRDAAAEDPCVPSAVADELAEDLVLLEGAVDGSLDDADACDDELGPDAAEPVDAVSDEGGEASDEVDDGDPADAPSEAPDVELVLLLDELAAAGRL